MISGALSSPDVNFVAPAQVPRIVNTDCSASLWTTWLVWLPTVKGTIYKKVQIEKEYVDIVDRFSVGAIETTQSL